MEVETIKKSQRETTLEIENLRKKAETVGAGLRLSCLGSSLGGSLELKEKRGSRQVEK